MKIISKREKNKINEIISNIIDNETSMDLEDELYKRKRDKLEQYFIKEKLNEADFLELQKLSTSKNGFLNNTFRRNLWKKILSVKGNNNIYEFVVLSEEKKTNFDKIYKTDQKWTSGYDRIIELDTHRSMINNILNSGEHSNEINIIKEELNTILKRNSAILEGRYHYYQGFHDLALYIILLYISNINIGTLILQRISEFFLRDYLSEMKENDTPDFNMINKILTNLIEIKEPHTIKKLKSRVEVMEPYFALSWILSWFTHNLTNITKIYRVIDFLICSHPLAVFHMSAEIICQEITKLLDQHPDLDGSLYYESLQNIKFNDLDYDLIIERSNISLKNYPHNIVLKPFLNSITRKLYPLANENILQKELLAYKNTDISKTSKMRFFLTAILILGFSMILFFSTTNFMLPLKENDTLKREWTKNKYS